MLTSAVTFICHLYDIFSITWDTPIKDILGGDFRLSDDLRTENANLRDVLAHKLGVPGYFSALMVGFYPKLTREELVRYRIFSIFLLKCFILLRSLKMENAHVKRKYPVATILKKTRTHLTKTAITLVSTPVH